MYSQREARSSAANDQRFGRMLGATSAIGHETWASTAVWMVLWFFRLTRKLFKAAGSDTRVTTAQLFVEKLRNSIKQTLRVLILASKNFFLQRCATCWYYLPSCSFAPTELCLTSGLSAPNSPTQKDVILPQTFLHLRRGARAVTITIGPS
ncbi:hypothetical protein H4Q26_006582 [Puccinia striiformis f. sp. tritici PST-130]|nr:hypothetical protein H4Q26_006582 [Puccinia striiformis f. sp. tritici PST-130]